MAAGGVSKPKFNEFSSKEGMNGPGNKQKMLTSKDLLRWFTDCGCLSKGAGKANTSNNLDIAFSSTKGKLPGLFADKIDALVKNVAKAYAKDNKCSEDEAVAAITGKLNGGEKAAHGTTKTANKSTTDKMTDTSKYTGASKERFGADGQGKGLEGREDTSENTGYVGNYKGAGTKK